MKKYLSIAALLAVIAFASVAILAQAEPVQTNAVAPASNDSKNAQAPHDFLQDSDACISATMKKDDTKSEDTEHVASADEQKAFIACMTGKGYTADDVKARLNDDEGGGDDPASSPQDK